MKTFDLLKRFVVETLSAPSGNVRGTTTVRPNDNTHTWEELGDEDVDINESKWADVGRQASCMLIFDEDMNVLAVSRKNNPDDFGLPGGKVDVGETPEEAAVRELMEETGLIADINSLVRFFVADDGEYVTYTFIGKVNGEVNTDESGVVRWVKPADLLRGSFADYNLKLFRKLGMV